MVAIHYIDCDGNRRAAEAEIGASLMEVAVKNGVAGIDAECGGACTCATCHVYVDDAWVETVGAASSMEQDTLDFAFDVRPNSRLACQIKVRPELDGVLVTVAQREF